MASPSPKFWATLKKVLLILAAAAIVAAVVCYVTLDGLRQTFFSLCCLIIAANLLLMYGFVRVNDKRRPKPRNHYNSKDNKI